MTTPGDHALLRRAIELADKARASGNPPFGSLLAGPDGAGLRRVVFALSGEQLLDIRPGSGRPPVPQDGPALFDEVRTVVEGYYR